MRFIVTTIPFAYRWLLFALFCFGSFSSAIGQEYSVYEGEKGPGLGKQIVLISGDEEYRSEEALPQLGKILAHHHGFKCIVLYAIGKDGTIDPTRVDNIPGLETLKTADLMIIATRFRDLPDDQMKHIVEYLEAGKPVIGMRTATHAFRLREHPTFARYSFRAKDWPGGFGKQVLGETWVSHHGHHGVECTRGVIAPGAKSHPILQGIEGKDIYGPTDVYTVNLPLPGDSKPLVLGQVLVGMDPNDPPETEKGKNDPMMPVAWTKTYSVVPGKVGRVFTTTMGASQDLLSEGLRRLLVNASYWALGMEDQIPAKSNVALVGKYEPTPFGFGKHKPGVRPSDL
jgi:type 1 glutamine amidotransferase